MKPIPDYFLALVKQGANYVSNDEAERAIRAVTSMLDTTIEPARAKRLFSFLPSYLQPSKNKFFVKLTNWQPRYRHQTALERLKLNLQLTDHTEVENLLQAYFKAVKVVLEPRQRVSLARILPPELNHIYLSA